MLNELYCPHCLKVLEQPSTGWKCCPDYISCEYMYHADSVCKAMPPIDCEEMLQKMKGKAFEQLKLAVAHLCEIQTVINSLEFLQSQSKSTLANERDESGANDE